MKVLPFESEYFRYGVEIYSDGGLIVFPTDTVYGLGGNPFREDVVSRIFELKRRSDKPLPILVASIDSVHEVAYVPEGIRELLKSVWPGSVTLILRSRRKIPASLYGDWIGVRIPGDEGLMTFIDMVGGYIVGTSANISGYQPSKTVEEAIRYFGDEVQLYYDGGNREGRPSTVIQLLDDGYRVLRYGDIDKSYIDGALRKIYNV